MHRSIALAALLPLLLLACSGNAVVEPADKLTKRGKAFIAKCAAPPPQDGTEVKDVYACLVAEDACPAAADPKTAEELGYGLEKGDECGDSTVIYDVPCGPDLNAVDCCYVVRLHSQVAGCL